MVYVGSFITIFESLMNRISTNGIPNIKKNKTLSTKQTRKHHWLVLLFTRFFLQNCRTYVGETALHIAAQYNDGAMIQALLASHADLEELTVDSRS